MQFNKFAVLEFIVVFVVVVLYACAFLSSMMNVDTVGLGTKGSSSSTSFYFHIESSIR